MEKLHSRLFSAVALLCALCSCGADRSEVLKVYNWSNYIGEGVIDDFKQWYAEQTGKRIDVIYQTFDINETMLAKIEKGHEDFDVVCPSDYIIERMLGSDMLLPLDFSAIPDSLNYIVNNRSPFMTQMFRNIRKDTDANLYSVPFMWGTTGILYNTAEVSAEEASTWEIVRNPKFAGRIFIKDAPRDVYGPILIHLKQAQIANGEVDADFLMRDPSPENIALVEDFLKDARDLVAGWEADFGKEQMTRQRGVVSLNWSGDAMWAMEEGASVGIDLAYTVPEEGSNVWFDGWVIPKYAQNVSAATLFIDFMCRPDIAIRNMEETGYVSANGDISVLESQIDESLDPVDVSYFFGPEAAAVRVDPAMYPDRSTIEGCVMMHDWGADTDKLIAMWSRIKGDNASSFTYIIIIVAAVAVAGGLVIGKAGRKSRGRKKAARRRGR